MTHDSDEYLEATAEARVSNVETHEAPVAKKHLIFFSYLSIFSNNPMLLECFCFFHIVEICKTYQNIV